MSMFKHIDPTITEAITYNSLHGYLKRFNRYKDPVPDQLAQLVQLRPHMARDIYPDRRIIQDALNEAISDCLEILEERQPELAKLLLRRFVIEKREPVRDIARRNTGIHDIQDPQLKTEEARLNQMQKKAILELVEIMRLEEAKAIRAAKTTMEHALGTRNYHRLIGTQSSEKVLFEKLVYGDQKDILLLTGQGGIGKTSIADALIRQAIDHLIFFDVIRLDIKGGTVTAALFCNLLYYKLFGSKYEQNDSYNSVEEQLKTTFNAFNYLVFVDGIEDNLDPILEKIRVLAGPTKFIVTSRALPLAYRQLVHRAMTPLPLKDGLKLFQTTLSQIHNHPEALEFEVDKFEPVFEKVGGNPLAIKLVAALTKQMTLPEILADLQSVEHPDIQMLYKRVYERIWAMLDQVGKQIMISLALFEKNAVSQELLLNMNSFDQPGLGLEVIIPSQLKQNLDLLIRQSLVERSGSFWGDRYLYGLHNLTHSFLRTSIIQWPVGFEIAERYGHITPLPQIEQGLSHWLNNIEDLDDGTRSEDNVIKDLNSISEIIDWGLYWPETRTQSIDLLQAVWRHLQRHGYFQSLEKMLFKAVEYLQDSVADKDRYTIIRLKNRLGEIYRSTHRPAKAYGMHTQNLIQAQALGNDVLVAQTQCLVAEDLIHLNQENEAEPLLLEAYATLIESDEQYSWVSAAATSLGRIYLIQRDYEKSLDVFDKLLSSTDIMIHEVDRGRILHNAGLAAEGAGRLSEAQDRFKQALDLLEGRALEQANVLKDLANLYIVDHELDTSIQILKDAEKLVPAGVGKDHIMSQIKHKLGYAYLRLNNLVEAEQHMVQAVLLLEKEGQSWRLAEALGILGEVYLNNKQYTRAIEIYEKALEMSDTFPIGSSFEAEVRDELAQAREGLRG